MSDTPERLADLLRRFSEPDAAPPPVPQISLAAAVASGKDPLHILAYMGRLGITVHTLDDLLAINDDPDEEEIHSFRVAEGVAVSVASQGEWLVFVP